MAESICNTRKDNKQTYLRDTVGLHISAWPCGVVNDFVELHGSESISQVHANLLELLGDLPPESAQNLVGVLYDDMCHLKPFSEKEENQGGPIGKLFASKLMAVDKLHFRGHRGAYCQANCDPWKLKELDGVNTPVCEQTFAWINRYTQCHGMNESRFFWFFLYLIDLRNNAKEEKLRTLLDPNGEERKLYCDSLSKTLLTSSLSKKDVLPLQPAQPYQEHDDGTYSCSYCARSYKQLGSLAKHLDTNHAITNAVSFKCSTCGKSFETKFKLTRHVKTCK